MSPDPILAVVNTAVAAYRKATLELLAVMQSGATEQMSVKFERLAGSPNASAYAQGFMDGLDAAECVVKMLPESP